MVNNICYVMSKILSTYIAGNSDNFGEWFILNHIK